MKAIEKLVSTGDTKLSKKYGKEDQGKVYEAEDVDQVVQRRLFGEPLAGYHTTYEAAILEIASHVKQRPADPWWLMLWL